MQIEKSYSQTFQKFSPDIRDGKFCLQLIFRKKSEKLNPPLILKRILKRLASLYLYKCHSMSSPYSRITTNIIKHIITNKFINTRIDITGKKHDPHTFESSLASSMVNDDTSYETIRLRSLESPAPSGLFEDYLSKKKIINRV